MKNTVSRETNLVAWLTSLLTIASIVHFDEIYFRSFYPIDHVRKEVTNGLEKSRKQKDFISNSFDVK